MTAEITDSQVGGTVVTSEGETIGTVERIEEGVAYVDPATDASDTLTATLGWDDEERATAEGDYPLPRTAIDSVGGEEITLQRGGGEIDRSDEDDPHGADADPGKGEEGDAETDQEAVEAARNSEAEGELKDSIEREQAARNSANPNAHRDEEPFES